LKQITEITVREKKRLLGIVCTVLSNKVTCKDDIKKNYIGINKNGTRAEFRGAVNWGNSCCPSVQNISCSNLLAESVRIKTH